VVDPNFLIRVLSAPGFQETAPEPALSTTSESFVIDLGYGFSVSEITLPVTDINLALLDDEILTVFTSLVNADEAYEQASEPVITLDSTEISIQFSQPIFTRYIKLHSSVHYINADGEAVGFEQLVSIDSTQISVGVSTTGINEFFNYTPDGNRAAKSLFTDALSTEEYEYYSGSDRLMIAGGIAYRYDANGNLTEQGSSYTGTEDSLTIAMSEDYRQYRYDLLNRLTEVLRYQDGNLVTVARYGYDINSLRIYKEDGEGKTTHYVYDATGNRLETHTEETSSYYIFRGLRHVARRIVDNATQTEVRHYYGTDHLGSTVLVTGEAGEVLWSGETNPFGDNVSGEGIVGESERIKYTGKDWDEDAGLYYFNARWYDPGTGRFITEDPARDGASWFAYVANNPLIYIDPSGLLLADIFDSGIGIADEGISEAVHIEGLGGRLQEARELDAFREEEGKKAVEFAVLMTGGMVLGSAFDVGEMGFHAATGNWAGVGMSATGLLIPEILEPVVKTGLRWTGDLLSPLLRNSDVITDTRRMLPDSPNSDRLLLPESSSPARPNWPLDDGFEPGTKMIERLEPGQRIDRFGPERGVYTSPIGTPYENRALLPGTNTQPYGVYEVVEPLEVVSGRATPWFGEPGGGIQYLMPDSISNLINDGILIRIME
jgi:RHS repeat-associated protein